MFSVCAYPSQKAWKCRSANLQNPNEQMPVNREESKTERPELRQTLLVRLLGFTDPRNVRGSRRSQAGAQPEYQRLASPGNTCPDQDEATGPYSISSPELYRLLS